MRGDRPTPPGPATVSRIVGGVAAAGMVALGTELVVFGGADPTRLPAEGPVLSWLASLPSANCTGGAANSAITPRTPSFDNSPSGWPLGAFAGCTPDD